MSPKRCKCLLLNAPLKPGAVGAPRLPGSKPLLFSSAPLLGLACQQREVSAVITSGRRNAACLACVCYRCLSLQSCYTGSPIVRTLCRSTHGGFLPGTAEFSTVSNCTQCWVTSNFQCFPRPLTSHFFTVGPSSLTLSAALPLSFPSVLHAVCPSHACYACSVPLFMWHKGGVF